MTRPRVSIVIPTLDRSHLLQWSLRSAVEQTYRELEIVVSNNRSTDRTEEVIASFLHPGLIVVRPDRRLTMPENFEFGLDHATGDYVTFITDDSYLLPDCIDRAMAEIERLEVPVVVWTNAGYVDERWIEPQRRNTLYIPKSTYQVFVRDSREAAVRWFHRIRDSRDKPRAINSLCRKDVIDTVRAVQGAFFLPPAPDHTSGVGVLMNTERYGYLDEPLVVDVIAPESTGPSQSFTMGRSAEDFYKSFGSEMSEVTFLGLPTTTAIIAQSLENVRRFYADRCPPLDVQNVLSEIVDSLAKLEAYGSPVAPLYSTIDAFARRTAPRMRWSLTLKRRTSWAKWSAVRLVRSSRLLYRLESLRGLSVQRADGGRYPDVAAVAAAVARHNVATRAARYSSARRPVSPR